MNKRKHTLIVIVSLTLALFLCASVTGTESAAKPANVTVEKISLFKNGLGYITSEVTLGRQTSFAIVPSAAASHGTFWINYPQSVKFLNCVAGQTQTDQQVDAMNIADLLRANVGSNITISIRDEESEITGRLKYFGEQKPQEEPSPYSVGRIPPDPRRPYYPQRQAELLILDVNGKDVAVMPQNVVSAKFTDGSAKTAYTQQSEAVELTINLKEPAPGKALLINYLAKGITWAPSYAVDITESENAMLSAKAAIINEIADLDNVDLDLVTGFPNLQFAEVVSPLAMKENLAQFMSAISKGQSQRGRAEITSNVMAQSAWYDRSGEVPMPAYGTQLEGQAAEDLFLYTLKSVNLKKNQTGYFPVFSRSIPYRHIYEWQIPDYTDPENQRQSYRRDQQQTPPEEVVWHSIRLTNSTDTPWTTAPAQILKDGNILGQDTLRYTPAKGRSTVRITRAVAVKAEQVELETEREREAARFYGYSYDLVTLEGRLSVTNFQDKLIELEITKTLSGEVLSTTGEPQTKKLAKGINNMNGKLELLWNIALQPEEQKDIDYTYKVYVRR